MKLISSIPFVLSGMVAVGGVAQSNFFPSQSESESLSEDFSFNLSSDTIPEPTKETKCIVYQVELQSHGNNNWSVTKIISAKEKEEFLKSVVSSHQGFTDSVRDACAGRKSNYPGWNHVQVYVYKHNDGQWVYNEPLQYGWTRVKEVVNQTNMR